MNAPQDSKGFRVIGTRPVRPDGIDKVTGKAIYGTDHVASNMLFAAMLRSPHPHARIKRIDTRKAEALPGVKAVITGRDFPVLAPKVLEGMEARFNMSHIAQNCMALDKVLYAGHAVAAVAASSTAIAEEAAALIEVDYEILPHVIGIEAAMAPGAPVLHDDVFTKGLATTPDQASNVVLNFELAAGDPVAAITGAAAVASGRYATAPVHQGYIEPHAAVASWNADGQAQIWCSSQGQFDVRSMTANVLDISATDIRVMPLEIGGGFGGKTTIYLEPVAMLLSRKAGRPVRIAMSRAEVFLASGPAPGSVIDIRMGAAADGTLLGAEIDFKYDGGAYPGSDVHPGAMSALMHYKIADRRVTGQEVLCNMPSTHAYRAPGAPQVVYAVECCIDELAQQLGIDPIELRLKNAVRPGDPNFMGMPMGNIGFAECLEAARDHPHYSAPLGKNQARGVGAGGWGNYGGPSTAAVSIAGDGSVQVTTGNPDIGGSRASMAIMAAETLQVPYESVRVTVADTASIGSSMGTGGSRVTFATGKAVIQACDTVIATMKQRAAAMWGAEADQVEWRDGAVHCLAGDKQGESLTMAAIASRSAHSGGPISAEGTVCPVDYLPGYGVHICDTEVDPETGAVTVVRYTAVQDTGTAIHPDYVEGQIQGGAVQGIGWALNEAYLFDKAGRMDNPGFLDYRMPVCSDMPMIDAVMVQKPNPAHPFGVKGVGETPIVPPLGAVANSVSRAAGVRLRDLPMTPDKVYAAMQAKA